LKKRKEKRSGIPKEKGQQKKKLKKKRKVENIRQAWQENPKERDPTGGTKIKKRKEKKKTEAPGDTLLFWPQKNVSNWGGSTGSPFTKLM